MSESLEESFAVLQSRVEQLIAERDALTTDNARLREALYGVKRSPDCWCKLGVHDLAVKKHSSACQQARAALSGKAPTP